MAKTIEFTLSSASIQNAIKSVEAFRDSLERKKDEILKKLADIGLKEASVRFTSAAYDAGVNDSNVTVEEIEDGYCIKAEGKAVAFIEFGAGVYYNPSEPYPNPRPSGIVGIGEYGKGHGKRNAWGFKDESGQLHVTHGNRAAMPMWHASEEIRKEVVRIYMEVFGND